MKRSNEELMLHKLLSEVACDRCGEWESKEQRGHVGQLNLCEACCKFLIGLHADEATAIYGNIVLVKENNS